MDESPTQSPAKRQLPTVFLQKVLKSVLKKEGLDTTKTYDVTSSVAGNQENWMTSVYRVVVYPDNRDITKRRAFFFKCLPASSPRSDAFKTPIFFNNEVIFYDQVLPALLRFQSKHSPTTPFTGAARCYKCVSDGVNDVLVMEDLESRGYVMLNRLKGMAVDETSVMFEELGRFHALSLAAKQARPDAFAAAKSRLREALFTDLQQPVFGTIFQAAAQDALRFVRERHAASGVYATRMQTLADDVFATMTRLATPDPQDDQYNVITHGDLWSNNFLFHFRDTGASETVDRMCFLDFQACRYASLGVDLACALYLSLDAAGLAERRDALVAAYHGALTTLLAELGGDVGGLSVAALETLLKKYGRFGVGMACLNIPVQLNEGAGEEAAADGGVVDAVLAAFKRTSPRAQERIVSVVVDAVDRGYLD